MHVTIPSEVRIFIKMTCVRLQCELKNYTFIQVGKKKQTNTKKFPQHNLTTSQRQAPRISSLVQDVDIISLDINENSANNPLSLI